MDVQAALKAAIKRGLAVAGLEIHRSQNVRLTQAALLQHCARLGFRPRTAIDVGVGFGTWELYRAFPRAHHLLVEPLREYEPTLRRIERLYSADHVLAAAGSEQGVLTINVHAVLEHSTIYAESDSDRIDDAPRTVPVVTLDEVCRDRNVSGPYLIKADVQGAELQVLDGASRTLQDTELVVLEVSLMEFFKGAPQFYDVVHYMKERGFVVYDVAGRIHRPLDNALSQLDVAFVKEDGMFRREHIFTTKQQRLVAHRRALAAQKRQAAASRR